MSTGIRRRNYGRGHGYTIDGETAMGVTTALSLGLPKGALPHAATKTLARILRAMPAEQREAIFRMPEDAAINAMRDLPFAEWRAKATRGIEVHSIAEQLIRGEPVAVPDRLASYVDSAVRFMNERKPVPVLVEFTVGSRQWMYAGTGDLVADMPDGRRLLLDYKTSESGIWPETALQLSAYRYADAVVMPDGTEMPMSEVKIDGCAAVWVRPDGYDVIPVVADEQQYKAFLHILYTARVTKVMSEWVLPAEYA